MIMICKGHKHDFANKCSKANNWFKMLTTLLVIKIGSLLILYVKMKNSRFLKFVSN